ncbi:hypothetical protein POTOM_008192 [Populus tomentosa]|uniref:Uncharacterized protein n=1 Tax=Populus tomentosa TaxID=118781 RepID=A0A8X8ADM1_POPTO|nr:hypothetical protein POTOM_008192 [Populus tomentosa]
MVFRSISATHPNTTNIVMASSTTVKPHQPLHNFPLQDLKWSMNPSNNATNHHRCRSNKSPHRDAAAADSDGDGGVKAEKLSKQKSDDAETLEKKSKIFIRLRTNKNSSGSSSSKCMVDDVAADAGDLDSAAVVEDVEESIPKTWNLRPRRAVNKGLNGSGGAVKLGGGAVQEIKSQVTSSNRSEWTRSNRNVLVSWYVAGFDHPGMLQVENVVLLLCRVKELTGRLEMLGKCTPVSLASSTWGIDLVGSLFHIMIVVSMLCQLALDKLDLTACILDCFCDCCEEDEWHKLSACKTSVAMGPVRIVR